MSSSIYEPFPRLKTSTVYKEHKIRMEIWTIEDFPDRFETTGNWPELFDWEHPHLFVVPDSYFPDH